MLRVLYGLIAVGLILTGPGAGQLTAQNILKLDTIDRFLPVWRYHEGDDSLWSRPGYPGPGWEPIVATEFSEDNMPDRGWRGIGWFRSRVQVDGSVVGEPVAIGLFVQGAAELYVDGELVDAHGNVGKSADEETAVRHHWKTLRPAFIVFGRPGEHLFAVRASNVVLRESHRIGSPIGGFRLRFATPDVAFRLAGGKLRTVSSDQFLFTGIPAVFAVVFLLLFAFYRAEIAHLLFGILCLGAATIVFLDLQSELTYDGSSFIFLRRLLNGVTAATLVVLVATTYSLLRQRVPLHFWAPALLGIGLAAWGLMDPFGSFPFVLIFILVAVAELVRSTVSALWRRQPRAWIVSAGVFLLVLGIAYDSLIDLGLILPISGLTNGYYYGMTGLEISVAVLLAFAFAQTNRRLERELVEVEGLSKKNLEKERTAALREIERTRLEAENRRRALELQKAEALKESYSALEKAHRKLKETQAKLVHREKMASLGRLTAGLAHEIKNPISFINNLGTVSVELATELKQMLGAGRGAPDPEQSEIVDAIVDNARRITDHGKQADRIVRSMIEHSRVPAGERRSVDLNRFIEDYVRLSHRGVKARNDDIDVHFECDLDPDVGPQEIVPESFRRAMVAILDNAFEAAIEGRAKPDHVPLVRVSTSRLRDSILIRVLDNGPGIPPEHRERIFEPFFTTKPTESGAGLGLSLAHEIIVEDHGGTLGLEQLTGDETGFYISIPNSPE